MSQYPYQSQPAWIDGRTAESAERERAFFRSVYSWMFVGLLLTALASTFVVFSPAAPVLDLLEQVIELRRVARRTCRLSERRGRKGNSDRQPREMVHVINLGEVGEHLRCQLV